VVTRLTFATLLFLCLASASLAQSDDPIDLQIEDYDDTVCYVNCGSSNNLPEEYITHTYTRVMIQAKVDSVTIERIEINRGNCRFVGGGLPQQLNCGEHVFFAIKRQHTIFAKGCNIIEVTVQTDQGDIVFTD